MPEYKTVEEVIQAISVENKRLRDEIERLSMELAWYGSFGTWQTGKANMDRGQRARAALNFGKPEF